MHTAQFQLLISAVAGWINRSQQDVIEYLQEENRVLREQLGGRRLLFTDAQRRRLAANGRGEVWFPIWSAIDRASAGPIQIGSQRDPFCSSRITTGRLRWSRTTRPTRTGTSSEESSGSWQVVASTRAGIRANTAVQFTTIDLGLDPSY